MYKKVKRNNTHNMYTHIASLWYWEDKCWSTYTKRAHVRCTSILPLLNQYHPYTIVPNLSTLITEITWFTSKQVKTLSLVVYVPLFSVVLQYKNIYNFFLFDLFENCAVLHFLQFFYIKPFAFSLWYTWSYISINNHFFINISYPHWLWYSITIFNIFNSFNIANKGNIPFFLNTVVTRLLYWVQIDPPFCLNSLSFNYKSLILWNCIHRTLWTQSLITLRIWWIFLLLQYCILFLECSSLSIDLSLCWTYYIKVISSILP